MFYLLPKLRKILQENTIKLIVIGLMFTYRSDFSRSRGTWKKQIKRQPWIILLDHLLGLLSRVI